MLFLRLLAAALALAGINGVGIILVDDRGRFLLPDPGDFEKDPTGFDYCHPMVQSALATSHASLGRLSGHRFIGEDTYPDVAASPNVAN